MPPVADRTSKGFCVWLTGLSGSGKSTLASELAARLAADKRPVTVFDGAGDPGEGREDRHANVIAMASRAARVVADGGIAICTLISPYDESRQEARALVGADRFVLVYVCTPLSVCETRDVHGWYDRARRQEIRNFVGVEEVFEVPRDADVLIDTSLSIVSIRLLLTVLVRRGYVRAEALAAPELPGKR